MKKPRYILRKVKNHKNSSGKWKLKRKKYNWKNIKICTFDSVASPGILEAKFPWEDLNESI